MPFSLTGNPSPTDISDAINYLLNNFGSNVSIDVNTGIVAGPSGGIGYLYKYLDIKYATSFDGSVGFSNSPTGATYYGSRNNNSSVESTNPADYIWTAVTGGFGTTKFIWYATSGGRQINVVASTTSPGTSYLVDPGTAIDLDVVTGTNALMAASPTIYQWTSGSAPARPTTTSTYTWSTASFTPPSGWYSSIPSNTTPGDTLWAIYIPLVVSANTTTSTLDWTNTSYSIVQIGKNGATGSPGAPGSPGSSGLNGTRTAVLTMFQWAASPPSSFPSGSSTYTWSTGTFTAPSSPNGWTITPSSSIAGDTLYAIDQIYSDNLTTATSSVTWSSTTPYAVGSSGVNGARTAFLQVYQWASSTPTSYPSGSSTYTWATATYTAPTIPNGWTLLPGAPIPGDILYVIDAVYSDNLTTATSTVNWTSTSPYPIGAAGLNGVDGAQGLSSITAYLVQNQSYSAPSTPSNTTGPVAPYGWNLIAPSVTVGSVLWYSFGQYNGNTITINGIPPGQTQWGTPTAASVFQDIRSDNWNGSNPPTAGTVSTYGTAGYYIQRTTGNMYLNSVYGRGIAQFDGANTGVSGVSAAMLANKSLGQSAGVEAYSNNSFLTSGALRAWNSSGAGGNAIYANQNGTGIGVLAQSTSGTGVEGTGDTGVNGIGYSTGVTGSGVNGVYGSGSSAGVYGTGGTYGLYGSGTYGTYSNGPIGTSSNALVNNLYSQYTLYLKGQASGASNLYFQTGPTIGSGTATFNPANKPGASTTNTWIEVVIGGTSYQIPVWAS